MASTMEHDLERSLELLSRTPSMLRAWLGGLTDAWALSNYGPDTFSPFDVIGHLLHGEKTDWMPRARWIREKGASQPFPPFDRFAQVQASRGKTLDALLVEFEAARKRSLVELRAMKLDEAALDLSGQHPALGAVTLRELLATWVVHDQDHIAQIARALSFQYADAVGPWRAYLPILPASAAKTR
ncbi:MAG TPA: DinB family protein [Planctomycetota bacterium]|nr:DinB family protein [Planctomycetota bacterium]